jgi:hypothetical protein
MPSELALAIAKRNKETTETVGALRLANDADAELEEVRDILLRLQSSRDCWCVANWRGAHDGRCERARALYERLRIDSGKGE